METEQLESKKQIIQCESTLLDAFMSKDLETVNELIHDDALFIYPNGLSVTKAIVLENYRIGNSAFSKAKSSDQIINLIGDTAIVSINLELEGKYHEELISAHFRYIRVWRLFGDAWRVIAVSGVPIVT